MARRFRKRRNTGIWLPVLGTEPNEATSSHVRSVILALDSDAVYANGENAVISMLVDTPKNRTSVGPTSDISEVVGNEYFLSRLVGKINIGVDQQSDTIDPTGGIPTRSNWAVQVFAGFFIAQADDNSPTLAIGEATNDGINYQVDGVDNIRQPWIWRRSWLLQPAYLKEGRTGWFIGQQVNSIASQPDGNNFPIWDYPSNNGSYGTSSFDGAHFDQKTKRRVRQEDRLWLGITARGYPFASEPALTLTANPIHVNVNVDLRAFGSLRKARNSGRY